MFYLLGLNNKISYYLDLYPSKCLKQISSKKENNTSNPQKCVLSGARTEQWEAEPLGKWGSACPPPVSFPWLPKATGDSLFAVLLFLFITVASVVQESQVWETVQDIFWRLKFLKDRRFRIFQYIYTTLTVYTFSLHCYRCYRSHFLTGRVCAHQLRLRKGLDSRQLTTVVFLSPWCLWSCVLHHWDSKACLELVLSKTFFCSLFGDLFENLLD